ncbi:hypothetical protein [Prosthecobacter fluviatilis]|uniref:DUF4342 domain-containing protein n=1 Tax=Prosthecobacter fluviatilis TaxID=445931 RepID=A0ABW0KRT5_9BACT
MNTIPAPLQGQAASFQEAASARNAEARFVIRNLHRIWQFRRMQATFLRPFRQALRPLLVWLRQDHVWVRSGQQGMPPVGLKLKQFGWETLALSLVLGPLAFIMLLPLLILIFPAAVLIALAAFVVAAVRNEAADAENHTLAWHAMH